VEDFAAAVLAQVKAQTAKTVAEFADVAVSFDVPHGAAGRELIKAADGARIVVVGSRGLGGFSGLLLGSVSDQVVEHASCDVLVIRRPSGDQSPPRTFRLDQAIEPD
jgi:nucleotide-binding universal stress UspA family protein